MPHTKDMKMEENMVGKDAWTWIDGMKASRWRKRRHVLLPKHVWTFFYYASSSDHEHVDESGMKKGYGREGMKKGDNDMKDMDGIVGYEVEEMDGIIKIKDIWKKDGRR